MRGAAAALSTPSSTPRPLLRRARRSRGPLCASSSRHRCACAVLRGRARATPSGLCTLTLTLTLSHALVWRRASCDCSSSGQASRHEMPSSCSSTRLQMPTATTPLTTIRRGSTGSRHCRPLALHACTRCAPPRHPPPRRPLSLPYQPAHPRTQVPPPPAEESCTAEFGPYDCWPPLLRVRLHAPRPIPPLNWIKAPPSLVPVHAPPVPVRANTVYGPGLSTPTVSTPATPRGGRSPEGGKSSRPAHRRSRTAPSRCAPPG